MLLRYSGAKYIPKNAYRLGFRRWSSLSESINEMGVSIIIRFKAFNMG